MSESKMKPNNTALDLNLRGETALGSAYKRSGRAKNGKVEGIRCSKRLTIFVPNRGLSNGPLLSPIHDKLEHLRKMEVENIQGCRPQQQMVAHGHELVADLVERRLLIGV
ncbi:hypothetical protein Pmar_PMAR021007 [Perkinsus marinus ATCC 50983]|uniref:Uncharacterized protein n=1 Tax=Perkinsus marinus (strain ATCC 50983 / TXsc) TaxID=423536 RepID=C5KG55_PERM5|nr:hypothetical protein Pmar_PMAR021007 [Perkinsus marinus ATCC 50983]EER16411.1 hypothetical protein Pmar_PMAR021007 [Perkinsus marinus ATCC 50983]|eukprot:XP_002784615.1 hypothetical protein Pmar_PMAR021007 [Perkinsus marinus ATCC 50983]